MFNVASSEFLVVMLVALVVIGPKDLPNVLRMAGRWMAKARNIMAQFRSGFDEMVRQSELDDLEKQWQRENDRIMAEHPNTELMSAGAPEPPMIEAADDDIPTKPDAPK